MIINILSNIIPASKIEKCSLKCGGPEKIQHIGYQTLKLKWCQTLERAFYNISPNNKSKIKKYISDKNIDFDEPKDIASLAGYVESLLAS